MPQETIHVYLMPGMAASPVIFEHIKLPEDRFKIHWLEWIMPLSNNESLYDYALRVSRNIKHDDIVLLGVSFGGVLVQEISKHVKVKKLIIVSSVKTVRELPVQMLLACKTKAYKLIPTQLAANIDVLAKYAFGSSVAKRMDLYKKYLSVNDPEYLSWAIKNMVCWKQESFQDDIVHIHGDNDAVFPIKNIETCITVKNGSHIMIINKYKWFNEHLPEIILNT
ncbi:alpha/beta hydrolase [Snuella sedimenti]|uniref:Alpha/beta hydrolase n=1 Tax=Snuella sedimenti TaxID=2798802 RepID=A0A8J7LYP7_9FLAO|nr:alpha/beta hydrolase [Snuella sedimenti]MBJ6368771.1 alpha/beta hydrolase [Snuella sedimenti]